ncbi:hypothetical protein MNV49_004682 [Pseudohyphozyma bogoriensis]|nr:hypothetical protein MNV49_004682 [Pseudohyphozyma bogoriensis]
MPWRVTTPNRHPDAAEAERARAIKILLAYLTPMYYSEETCREQSGPRPPAEGSSSRAPPIFDYHLSTAGNWAEAALNSGSCDFEDPTRIIRKLTWTRVLVDGSLIAFEVRVSHRLSKDTK